jgi:prepilin-type N-terminal cleavage/methylation domain-containing protein
MLPQFRRAYTLIELLIVVGVLAVVIAVLIPSVQKVKQAAIQTRLANVSKYGYGPQMEQQNLLATKAGEPIAPRPRARVKTFEAKIVLTPKLSVGTATPESIYEAQFTGTTELVHAQDGAGGDCEIELPLPPQIISLSDLSIKAAGQSSEMVALRDGKLIWRGALKAEPIPLEVKYTAIGKGLYELSVPPGGILDRFQISLDAKGSDLRMLELSLQPTELTRSSGTTTYTWNYERLLFGQPIRLDVLGIAPIDRLGELTWLGPLSVVVFGLLIGLVIQAAGVAQFDRWMLLLTVGAFAGTYPLMYFAQEYISLGAAVLAASGLALAIIAVRAITLMPAWLALLGVVLPGAVILTITLIAAIWPSFQGILLTAEALAFFITAMMLIPKLHFAPALPQRPVPEPPGVTG